MRDDEVYQCFLMLRDELDVLMLLAMILWSKVKSVQRMGCFITRNLPEVLRQVLH